jgi:PAS domain S-box-containing protein
MNAAVFAGKTAGSRPAFQKGLAIAAASLVALLVLSAGLGYWNTLQLRENDAWVIHSDEVLNALEGVLSTMDDAETGQRGYLITGDDRYLEPYHAAVAAIHGRVQRVKQLTADNPRQQARIPLLEEQISAKLKALGRDIVLSKKDPEAARQTILTGEGKKEMEAIRAQVRTMEQEERDLLITRNRQSRRSYLVAVLTILFALVLGLGMVGAIVFVMQRHLSERQEAEEALRGAALFPDENPNPVLRIGRAGAVLYVNESSAALGGEWRCEVGRPAAEPLARLVRETLDGGQANQIDVESGGRVFSFLCAPIADSGYVNFYGRDITERKRAEEELARSAAEVLRQKDLLAVTLASIGDGVIVTDPQSRVTFLNGEAERLTGWTSGEAEGHPLTAVFNIINEHTRQTMEDPVEKVLRLGTVVGLANHTMLIAKDGREIPIDDSGAPIRQSDGTVQGVVLVFRDFTQQKQAERSLARLAAIVESSDDAILSKDLHGVIQTWNAGADRLLGYRAEEVIGRPITLLLPPERIREEEQILERLLSGQRVEHLETVRVAKDGRRIDVSVTVSPVKGQDGQIIGASKIIRDITDRKQAEEALARERANLQAVFDVVNVGMLVIGEDGSVKQVNDTLSRWVKKDVLAWEGGQPGDFVGCVHALADPAGCGHGPRCPSCPIRNAFASVLQTRQPVHGVETEALLSVAGSEVPLWLEVSADPLVLDGKRHVILAMNNITDRKQAETTLHQTAEDLARSNKDLEQFAYVASHDLKEPLRMVTGFMDLLKDRCQGKLDAKSHEYIAFAADAASRMRGLIDDLLTYSRAGRGEVTERTDVGAVFDRVLKTLTISVKESGAVITHDPLPTIASNPLELTQVFQNLIGNAIKFRGERKPEIRVGARRQPGCWLFTVRDNGIGIDSQFAERIFMIFQRLHTREQYPGTGVGLAICKKIVERHGGRIWMESQPGKGSTFCFTISDQGKDKNAAS